MASPANIAQKLQNDLEPYVKSREQVNYIRRILAVQLAQCTRDGSAKPPLALADSAIAAGDDEKNVSGIYKEYLDELRKNSIARKEYSALQQDRRTRPVREVPAPTPQSSPLEERIALLKLHRKRDALYAVQESLDSLSDREVASNGFLDTDQMFQGTPPLPSVPKDVINSMVIEQSSSAPDLDGQVNQLEKIVLRAKLLLRQEEQLLREAKSQSNRISQPVRAAAKLDALNVTRDELINWIETELSKASAGGQGDGDEQTSASVEKDSDPGQIAASLHSIQEKYAQYTAGRKMLLSLIAQTRHEILQPPSRATEKQPAPKNAISTEETADYLVTSYLEQLIAISQNQKSLMVQKRHMTNILSQQSEEAGKVLGHLEEESQLLQVFPMKDSQRRRSGIPSEVHGEPDLTGRIKPWVFAADSAKIATLEYVAETVENGQVALEGLMQKLHSLGELTGQESLDETTLVGDEPSEEDVWMPSPQKTPGRTHSEKRTKAGQKVDIWSKLHGNLGLLGHEGP